jgi:hypothetical protein
MTKKAEKPTPTPTLAPTPATVHKPDVHVTPNPEEARVHAELLALEVELDRYEAGFLGMGIVVTAEGKLVARPVRQFDSKTGKVEGYAVGIFEDGKGLLGILGSFASLASWPVQLAVTGVSRAVR